MKFIKRGLMFVVTLCLMVFVFAGMAVNAETSSFSAEFKSGNSANSDSSTTYTTSSELSNIFTSGAENFSTVSNVSKAYAGKTGYGIKLGSSSASGSIAFTLKEALKVKTISVVAKQYGSDTGKIKLNGNTINTVLTSEGVECSYTYDSATSMSTVTIATTEKRAYVMSLTVVYEIPDQGTYNIGYVLNGGTNSVNNPTEFSKNTGIASFENPTKNDYIFEGWYSKDGTNGDWGNKITAIASGTEQNVTLYAKWSKSAHLLFTELNTSATMNVEFDTSIVSKLTSEKYSHDFKGEFANGADLNDVENDCEGHAIVKFLTNGASNAPKYYDTGTGARAYNGNQIVITSSQNIEKIVFNASSDSYVPSISDSSDFTSLRSGNSITVTVVGEKKSVTINTTSTSRIQTVDVYLFGDQAVDVTEYSFSQVDIRFGLNGADFTKELYDDLVAEANGQSITFGVAVCAGETWNEAAAKGKNTPLTFGDDENDKTLSLLLTNVTNYSQTLVARSYVCINGVYYYAVEKTYSVNTLAGYYVANKSTEDSVAPYVEMLTALSSASYVDQNN